SSWPEGFNLNGTYYFMKDVGLTGDFSYATKSFAGGTDAHLYGFNFGPQFKMRSGRLEPFAHALFGATHGSASGTGSGSNPSDTAFSMKLGGGLDVAVAHHFAVRLGEFDYYYTRFSSTGNFSINGQNSQNNYTFGAGIVIR
ncbi:MAG: outer membrane beta-barrel protein, partial [Terriglobales bacterium]